MSCPGAAAQGPCQPCGTSTVSPLRTSDSTSIGVDSPLEVVWWKPKPGPPSGESWIS